MSGLGVAFIGTLLILATGFFVAAEFALVSARRSAIESGSRRGSRIDKLILAAMDRQDTYVAAIQVWITFLTIMVGVVVEGSLSTWIESVIPWDLPESVVKVFSIAIVSYPLLVVGELVPKYIALRYPEALMRATVPLIRVTVVLTTPLNWLIEKTGLMILKLIRVKADAPSAGVSREELYYLIRAGEAGGGLHESQADFVSKALRLDQLDAEDAMLHRLDIKWIDAGASRDVVVAKLAEYGHSRVPVCNGDIDDVVGILYLQDVIRNVDSESFDLKSMVREAVYVPESLTLNRLVEVMRETKSQIVMVQDEYGGTQGLLTLEDLIEEVFGDIEDTIESERAVIERTSEHRLSVKGDVRYDELLDFLDAEDHSGKYSTEALAAIIVEGLGRTARLGDTFEIPIGRLRVEQMAKRRIIRVGVYLRDKPSDEE